MKPTPAAAGTNGGKTDVWTQPFASRHPWLPPWACATGHEACSSPGRDAAMPKLQRAGAGRFCFLPALRRRNPGRLPVLPSRRPNRLDTLRLLRDRPSCRKNAGFDTFPFM